MSDHVKNPKIPHQRGEVGQSFIQVRTMRLNYTRGQNYTHFQSNTVHSSKPMGDETLHQEPSPHIRTDTYLHIYRFKRVILASIYPKEMFTVLAMYHHLTSQYPSLVFPLFAEAARSIHTSPARNLSGPGSMWYSGS